MLRRSHVSVAVFGICVAAFAASAHADDLDGRAWGKLRSANNPWQGFYFGVNAGYAISDTDTSDLKVFDKPAKGGGLLETVVPNGLDPDGGFGGGQIGFNHQSGHLVLGVEADIQASDVNDSSLALFPNPAVVGAFGYTASLDLEWFGTVRGRVGYSDDGILLYVTGGVAYGQFNYDGFYDFLPLGPGNSFGTAHRDVTTTGYVIGGGFESILDPNWSMKFEYQYLNFGDENVVGQLFFANGTPSTETFRTAFDVDLHTVRFGLNYHIN